MMTLTLWEANSLLTLVLSLTIITNNIKIMKLVQFSEFINRASQESQEELITSLYEPCQPILNLTVRNQVFMKTARSEVTTYKEFIELIRSCLLEFATETKNSESKSNNIEYLVNIVSSHPRIGETKNLSVHSMNEQKNLQKYKDSPEVMEKLKELNQQYEKVYPRLKFIVFVNGRVRQEIIKVMEERIMSRRPWFAEVKIALNELCDIAQDRIDKWQKEGLCSKY